MAAEFAAVDEDWLYPTPEPLPDTEAAAMALVGITAHLGLFQFGQLKSGEIVYVPGGTGGVGSMVVQMAKAAGAASPPPRAAPRESSSAAALGADLALNYKTDDIPGRLREFAPEGVDVWYETQREPEPRSLHPPAPQARPADPDGRPHRQAGPAPGRLLSPELRDLRLRHVQCHARPSKRQCAADIIRCDRGRQLKPIVGRTFPLAPAAEAHRFLEENTLKGAGSLSGKVVITIPRLNLLTTFAGSMMEGFLPRGWDLARIDGCCAHPPESDRRPPAVVAPRLRAGACDSVADFDVMMGHEIAMAIQQCARRRAGRGA